MASLDESDFSSGLEIIEAQDIQICIHSDTHKLVDELQHHFSGQEWALLFRGSWQGTRYCISHEFYCPDQLVHSTAVDFQDTKEVSDAIGRGFNTVMHSHPFAKSNWFSPSDKQTLTANMECSILYSFGEFTMADLRIKIGSRKYLVLHPKVVVYGKPSYTLPEALVNKIKIRQFEVSAPAETLYFGQAHQRSANQTEQDTLENPRKYDNEFGQDLSDEEEALAAEQAWGNAPRHHRIPVSAGEADVRETEDAVEALIRAQNGIQE